MTVEAEDQGNEIHQKMMSLNEKQDKYNSHEKLFIFEQDACIILTKVIDDFSSPHLLWSHANE
jgi:hypothetical protein